MSIALIVAILIALFAAFLLVGPESSDELQLETMLRKRQFISPKHTWEDSQTKGIYFCSLCNKLMTGLWSKIIECKKCGIRAHSYCKLTNLKKPDCKYIIGGSNKPTKPIHQWRKSIHSINSICSYCESVCTGFQAYMCLWCHRIKHFNCKDEGECDMGTLKNMIISPNEIACEGMFSPNSIFKSLKKKIKQRKQKTSDDSENENTTDIQFHISPKKNPIVVLINKKSGGQTGNEYLKNFYLLLNPLQVISIMDEGLQRLKIFAAIKNLKIVVGGGDGTICSVLNYLTSGIVQNWKKNNPPVAVFPLGTGNDLSRALGWGSGGQDRDAKLYLEEVEQKGQVVQVDRWLMTIVNPEHVEDEKVFTVYNYLGVGLDARVCYDFHKVREKYPGLFVSPLSNKLIYTQMGAYDFIVNKNPILVQDYIVVEVDGKKADLHGLENIVLLNITHWAGGAQGLWKESDKFKALSMDDGIIEVLGVTDMLHLGQIQIGMEIPLQIAQGRLITIKSIKKCTMNFQIDGEPFELQSPFVVTVQFKDKINLLATTKQTASQRIQMKLEEAVRDGLITRDQQKELMNRLL